MASRIQIRRDTAANWSANNPTLASGEIAFVTDENKVKVGDGATAWNSLAYLEADAYLDSVVMGDDTTGDYVETLIASDGISISGEGQESASVTITNTGVLSLAGTTNEIEVSASSGNITLSLPTSITVDLVGDVTGNADTASTLATPRNISLGGDVSGSASFDGSADITITATVADDSHNHTIANVDGLQTAIDTAESDAVTTANAYSDGLASNYDPAGSASAVASDLTDHENATTSVHGIADTSLLATTSYVDTAESDAVSTANSYADSLASNYDAAGSASAVASDLTDHENATTNVHGIADTSALATKTYADNAASTAVANLVDSAPSTLDTLNELAAALDDDPNFATTITNSIATKADDADLTSHENATTNVHGIADTSALATKTYADNAGVTSLTGTASEIDVSASSGAITLSLPATINADTTGNAATASTLETARSISLSGDVSGSASFDGGSNVTITASVSDDSHNHTISNVDGLQNALDAKLPSTSYTASDVLAKIKTVDGASSELDADLLDGQHGSHYLDWTNTTNKPDPTITLTGDVSGSATLTDLNSASVTVSIEPNSVELGTDTSGIYVARISTSGDGLSATGSGESASVTLTNTGVTSLSGTASEVEVSASTGSVTLSLPSTINANTTGNSATSTKLATERAISLSGDVSGSANFDGSANISITATVADDSHNHVISNVDGLQTALDAKAPLESPALTGTPTAPTASASVNSTQIATTAFVQTAVSNLIDGAPGALDTLNELAASLGDDSDFAGTVTNSLAGKQPLDADLTAISGLGGTSGLLKKDSENTWSLDTNTYLTGNETITVSGDATGSGATSISLTLANSGVSASTYGSSSQIPVLTVDSKGRITSASAASVEGLPSQTGNSGKYLTTNGTAASWDTINLGTDTAGNYVASISGTANEIEVAGSGSENASVTLSLPATINANTTGSAASLTTARTISLGGDLSGSASFNGTSNITITAAVADDSHNHTISNIDGLQTELDAKLDSTSYTASDVLTKIKTVDGSTSGLDSDLLDGQHGSYYLDWTNTTNKPDPTITLLGDATGSATFTNLGSASVTVTVADDSHNHVISNVDGLQTALNDKAPLASPALTGTPTAPTAAGGTNTTQVATTAFVQSAVSSLVDSAPTTLDTLNELAAALDDDPNFATTVTNSIAGKQPLDADLTAIAALSGTSGFLKKTAANTWSLDTNTYLTGNQTITLSGDVSGSGTTSINVTVADDSHNHIISNVDGLQTALDAKLNSTSYTASDVLTKIKTVDGASSGLDADLLDGQHGSYYLDWTNVTNKPDPTITLGGDASGSLTMTDLAGGTLTVTISDDSHNHIISNIDGLQTALDSSAKTYYQTTAPSSPDTGDIWVDSDEVYTTINPNDYALKTDVAESGFNPFLLAGL